MNLYFLMMDGPLKHRLMKVPDASPRTFVVERDIKACLAEYISESIPKIQRTTTYFPDNNLRTYLGDGTIVIPATSDANTNIMLELVRPFTVNEVLK